MNKSKYTESRGLFTVFIISKFYIDKNEIVDIYITCA